MKNFKKTIFLSLLLLLGAISCSEDDDDNDFSSILGEWKLSSSVTDGLSDIDDCDFFIDFTNSVVNVSEFYGDNCDLEDNYSFNYRLEGNEIYVQDEGEGEESVSTILVLSETTLKIQSIYDEGEETNVSTYIRQ